MTAPPLSVTRTTRLTLGVQLGDAMSGLRLARPVSVLVEPRPLAGPLSAEQTRRLDHLTRSGRPLHDTWRRVPPHASGRHALVHEPGRGTSVDLRVLDAAEHYVPRRLRVPLAELGVPEDVSVLDLLPVEMRSCAPLLYPGAAYDTGERRTGLRGRVVVQDPLNAAARVPARWARVEARLPFGGPPIAWGHGDAHGEFLLLLPPDAIPAPAVELPETLTLSVTAHGRRFLPVGDPPVAVRRADPFWDVPLETLGGPGSAVDPVAEGRVVPAVFEGVATQTVQFTYGAIVSASVPAFDLT